METRFDDLTKALAEGIPRRQALRRLGSLFGAALLGSLAFTRPATAGGGVPACVGLPCGRGGCPNPCICRIGLIGIAACAHP